MAADLFWPWVTVAGLGALHGLNPATGWMLAAAWGLRSGGTKQALGALWPIGLGHVASVALVALLVVAGLQVNRMLIQCAVAALLLVSVAAHVWRRAPRALRAPAGQVGMALWSFLMSSLHGAGLMVVPALLPLCMSDVAAASDMAGSRPLLVALVAVGLHGAAMLSMTGLVAVGLLRGLRFIGGEVR
ncbi:hypothetical protein [Variovorax soli]|uniref:hypothetical protein n=1 Tax=Variovorax soli TaxID=376815 RepID=UPI0008398E08|nr:hypothetical protein [Variovorax soli]